eukprot:3954850-Amphidinium_carterae.1
MDPPEEQPRACTPLSNVAAWAGMTVEIKTLFLEYMGVTHDQHPRVLAYLSDNEWVQAGFLDVVCHLVCGKPGDDPIPFQPQPIGTTQTTQVRNLQDGQDEHDC